jgi:hypothetical protein
MTAPQSRSARAKPLDAGCLQPEISSFRLHLAAEGKAARTVRTYTEAVQWFAAARLLTRAGHATWDEVRKRDVQEWVAWLLGRYSAAYASNQFRALQQFFKWLADEDEIPDPMASLRPPHVPEKPVPVFTGKELTGWSAPARAARSSSAATRASSPCSRQPGSGCRSSQGSATTPMTRGAATWTCGTGRSPCTARAAGPGSSRSATTPPASSTATSAPAPGTPRHAGLSCGWASITGGR